MPVPTEELDGITFEYWNNPTQFIQRHISLFQKEHRHFQRYKESIRDYSDLNCRWVAAEDWYVNWCRKYEYDEFLKANSKGGNGTNG